MIIEAFYTQNILLNVFFIINQILFSTIQGKKWKLVEVQFIFMPKEAHQWPQCSICNAERTFFFLFIIMYSKMVGKYFLKEQVINVRLFSLA